MIPKSIPNTWLLGVGSKTRHVVLQAANTAGKSTLLQATLACALLAQSLTLAPCDRSCLLTPFGMLSSHMRVKDGEGRSLFQAELQRAHATLSALGHAVAPSLIVFDELCASTSPVLGATCASVIASRMAATPHALVILSTHFPQLAKLAGFDNFYLPVRVDEGTIQCTYTLKRGVLSLRDMLVMAPHLLRQEGFDAELVSRIEHIL
jgi:DNA mismatch repair ATPase MutS